MVEATEGVLGSGARFRRNHDIIMHFLRTLFGSAPAPNRHAVNGVESFGVITAGQ